MLLPSASHNTPEDRAKLRREAELDTRAALAKARLQEENQKKLHKQTLVRNIKKLQSKLIPKLTKLQYIKREIDTLKRKKQVAENSDKSLDQEQLETKKGLVEFDQATTKLALVEKSTIAKLAALQNELNKLELGNDAKQAEIDKIQKQVEEKTEEVEELKKQLVDKSNLNESNKARVQELHHEIEEKEKVLQKERFAAAVHEDEFIKNRTKLEELREEVIALKRQLLLKEKEVATLETLSRTLETRVKAEGQEERQGESNLDKLREDLRRAEILAAESARAVGYLERKIKEEINSIHLLNIHSGPKFDPVSTKFTTLHRDLELLNKQLGEVKAEIDQKTQAKTELERQIKSRQLVELNISSELKGAVSKIRVLEYEQTKLEKETDVIKAEIEKLESEMKMSS